jgi:hypothetical protein
MSILDCPFHKYLIVPFVDIFTLGIYGGVCNHYRLEKMVRKNLDSIKDGMEQSAGKGNQ